MKTIAENILELKARLPQKVKLIAVSKTKPAASIQEAYQVGQRIFGENKVQELVAKYEVLPKDIEWHMIGHLQSNKVKYMAHFVALIHGVDSFSLLKEINKHAQKNNRIQNVLLQFHVAQEETKFGFSYEEAEEMLSSNEFKNLGNISVSGIMGMASFTESQSQIRVEFKTLKSYFDQLNAQFFSGENSFKEISMGMSGDFQIAMEEGSTMIRVGSAIFGER